MQRLTGAFRFIDLNFRMAQSHEIIQKPWMYLSLGFVILTITWLGPLGALVILLGSRPLVWVLIGVILLLYLLSLLIMGEITALRTAQIFASLIRDDGGQNLAEGSMDIYSSYWLDSLIYTLSLPGLTILLGFQALISGSSRSTLAWHKATPLIPPMIALEDLELREAVARLKEIVAKNYLRFQPNYLPVGGIARSVQWVLIFAGIAAGMLTASLITDPFSAGAWRAFFAAGVGLIVSGVFSTAGIAFSTYFRTCYHTALYVWALKVQSSQNGAGERLASPPEILTLALQKKPLQKKAEKEKEGSDATET